MDPEVKETPYSEQVRSVIEGILQNSLGSASQHHLKWYQGKLSTNPERVNPEVSRRNFSLMCGTLSRELKNKLTEQGISADIYFGDNVDPLDHVYLIANKDNEEVIIDPTIGQFIDGYNHVFVGSRDDLRDLVLNQTGEDKKYMIVELFEKYSPQEVFELIWGSKSKPLAQKAKSFRKFLTQGFINRTDQDY